MNSEYFIYLLYIIPILVSLDSFQFTSNLYKDLPDKLPMNFNYRGTANLWWPKNYFSAYLIPAIGILINLSMCALMLFIHTDTGPLPDDYNWAFWFFDFSLVYLLYKSQQGILEYSLNKCDSILPSMSKGFVLLAIACITLVSLMFINNQPEIEESVLSADLKNGQVIDERDYFTWQDQRIYLLLKVKNIKGELLIDTRWLTPDGELYFKYQHKTHHKLLAKRKQFWSYINVHYDGNSAPPGQWQAQVLVNGTEVLTREFSISR